MISSSEVQQMQMGGLQSMQAQQQYGYSTGSPYGYGMAGHNMPMNSPGFSYAGTETGYGMGDRMGMRAVNSMQGAYKAGSYGVAGMGAMAGYKLGGMGGALRGGLMAGGPLVGAGMMAGGHVFGNMMEGAEEQQAVFSNLGRNFSFSNSSSRSGRGFSRQDAKAISDFTRELQAIPELMTSMGELNNIMGKVAQMGVMNGVRNAQEFNKRFKETVTTLKEVSKIMETTMEGAMQFFQEARQGGMYSPQQIKMNAMQRQFTAGVTGMNQGQIGQLQAMGAQTAFATGGDKRFGTQSALRSARQIGMANEMGVISNDRIMELTGQEGAAGIMAMAGGLTDAAQRMAYGGFGTAMSAALGRVDKSGKFTGEMDDELVERVRMGGISKSQLISLAQRKTSSQAAKISFKSQQDKLRSNMASSVGAEGIGMELQDVLGGAGWRNPDAVNLVMQRFGVDEKQAKLVQELGNALPGIQKELGSRAQTEGRRMAEQSYLKDNFSNEAIKRKFMKRIENTFSEPFKKIGADMSNAVGQYVDNFMDSLMDRHATTITKETASIAGGALGGGAGAQSKMASLLGGLGKMNLGTGSLEISAGQKAISALTGQRSIEMNKYDTMKSLSSMGMATNADGRMSMNAQQQAAAKSYYGNLQSGNFSLDHIKDKNAKALVGHLTGKVNEIMKEHSVELKKMTQMERVQFIKEKLGNWGVKGVSTEQIIANAQRGGGNALGAVDFNKLAGELMGTGDFGGAKELEGAERAARKGLSEAFGNQSSQVEALLNSDTKSRDLFLKAAGGDAEAQKLLTQNMSVQEREKLLKKHGISEQQLDALQEMYGGAKGKDVSSLAGSMKLAINRSSVGGLAAQLRRQGLDIDDRLGRAGIGGDLAKEIGGLASGLSGLTSAEKMSSFFSGGGSKQIDKVLGMVAGLKGEERERALSVLGEGASSAIGYGDYVSRQATSAGGLASIKDKLPEDLKRFIGDKQKLTEKEAKELGRMARNDAFGGSLAAGGTQQSKEIAYQKELGENLNRFAQTTSQFANLVIQATPQLAENVRQAQAAIASTQNITPNKEPNQSGG